MALLVLTDDCGSSWGPKGVIPDPWIAAICGMSLDLIVPDFYSFRFPEVS